MRISTLRTILISLLAGVGYASAQVSPYTVKTFPSVTMTATGQTSTVIPMLSPGTGTGNSFSAGSLTVTGTGLTTATFAVMGSSDGGATYFSLPLSPIASPGTTALTQTVTSSGGIFQVNLATITNVKYVTSGTFTATSIKIALSASPNGLIARSGSGTNATASLAGTAMADYLMTDGSGTTVTDSTGSGNSGTFLNGANAPTWTRKGLTFAVNQGVKLPATLNNAQTFFFAFYRQPFTAGPQATNTYPVLLASSLDNTAANVILNTFGSNPDNLLDAATPTVFGPSGGGTVCGAPDPGFHVLAVELDNTKAAQDRMFVDGVECAYTQRRTTGGLQTSGNLYLGSDAVGAWAGSGLIGTMYRFVAYPTLLSATDVAYNTAVIRNEVASRGVSVTPTPVVHAGPIIHFIGDSITEGITGTTNPYPNQLNLATYPTITKVNWGIGSSSAITTATHEDQRVALQCPNVRGPSLATVFLGTNDGTASSANVPYAVVGALLSEVRILKNAGCKVYVFTMMSRGAGFDSFKNTYDAQVVTLLKPVADGIIDTGADPLLGADGAYANTTYFNGDQVHPTNAGHTEIALVMNNSLNYYLSPYSVNNPHTISATATLDPADSVVTIGTLSAAANLTLPTCVGPSGSTRTIINPQSAYPVTIAAGSASEPINGLTTAITIPANSTVTLTDVPNSRNTAGCHWTM